MRPWGKAQTSVGLFGRCVLERSKDSMPEPVVEPVSVLGLVDEKVGAAVESESSSPVLHELH